MGFFDRNQTEAEKETLEKVQGDILHGGHKVDEIVSETFGPFMGNRQWERLKQKNEKYRKSHKLEKNKTNK